VWACSAIQTIRTALAASEEEEGQPPDSEGEAHPPASSSIPVTIGANMPVDCAMVLSNPVKAAAELGKMSSTTQ
jgi:hypothetical protein